MTFVVSQKRLSVGSCRYRHRVALKLLDKALTGHYASLQDYRFVESLLELSPLDVVDSKKVADRLHLHREGSGRVLSETNLPFKITEGDVPSEEPFLNIRIVMDNLRSAFNVGSIVRTTEAQRLGTLYGYGITPELNHPKVLKTSMGCADKVFFKTLESPEDIPGPFIGLETAKEAISLYEWKMPSSFTLILGNEEYGLSEEWLKKCDQIVKIPMWGFKNSLNVASAYAIAAYEIRRQIHSLKT